jgi:hypothetical protein
MGGGKVMVLLTRLSSKGCPKLHKNNGGTNPEKRYAMTFSSITVVKGARCPASPPWWWVD